MKKGLTLWVTFLLSLAVWFGLAIAFRDHMVMFLLVTFLGPLGMVLLMTRMSQKNMASEPLADSVPVSEEEIIARIRDMSVDDCQFKLTENNGVFTIEPALVESGFSSRFEREQSDVSFKIRIWLRPERHEVLLKDIVSSQSVSDSSGVWQFNRQIQMGMVTVSIILQNSSGRLVRISNADLRNALVNMFNQSGWRVSFKMF